MIFLSPGGRVLVTAGSQMKIDSAKAVGAEEGFNYKETDFAEEVLKYTGGKTWGPDH